jgi:hypothetical protein
MQVFDKSRASGQAPARASVSANGKDRLLAAVGRSQDGRRSGWLAARVLGALSLLAVGAVHLQQFFTLYSAIPTIGTLFVLTFAGATIIGLGLLAPVERLLGRGGGLVVALLSLGGIALAATAFVFLLISEHTPLFGFMEPGYDPPAILASRVAEAATVLLLGSFLVSRLATKAIARSW